MVGVFATDLTQSGNVRDVVDLIRDAAEAASMDGTVVGVYAKGSVGQLTHPATSTHGHLIYKDPATGRKVTGHLERFGLASGAVLKFPATAQQ